ncbi:MAG: tetratricopeptide repeat protein [Calothrix sp. SM1_7_51]|nr:tetratricopeptide repeat protein [Calothrix sp. SM1_7_51]
MEKVNSDVHNNQVARIKNFLAHSNVLLGYYEKAESLYEEALKIREKHSESEEKSFNLAKTLDGLGYLYSLIGDYDKSKDMLEKH